MKRATGPERLMMMMAASEAMMKRADDLLNTRGETCVAICQAPVMAARRQAKLAPQTGSDGQ